MKRMMSITGMFVAVVLAASSAQGQVTQIQMVNVTLSGKNIQPAAVSDSKWIVGNYTTNSGGTAGFLSQPNNPLTQTIICEDSQGFTRADGISGSNMIVGDYFGKDGAYHGYTYIAGSCAEFQFPKFKGIEKYSGSLFGISNGGANVAGAISPHNVAEGFVSIGGAPYELSPGIKGTWAYDVNDSGTAVGQFLDKTTSHGFIWTKGGGPAPINYPGSTWTSCSGISNDGTVVGTYIDTNNNYHGFTYNQNATGNPWATTDLLVVGISGVMTYMTGVYNAPGGAVRVFLQYPPSTLQGPPEAVNPTGSQSTSVYGIDLDLNLAGYYTDMTNTSHGLLLLANDLTNPIPIDNSAGGQSTVCQGLNTPANIICNYSDSSGNFHASVYNQNENSWAPIVLPANVNATNVIAYGINKNNDVAGTFVDILGNQHGFLLTSEGVFTQLDVNVKGATFTVASGVNSQDVVSVFWGDSSGNVESSVYFSGQWVTEDLPGATNVYVGGIDDELDLTYTWTDPLGNIHGGLQTGALSPNSVYYLWDVDVSGAPVGIGTRAYGIVSSPSILGPQMVGRYFATAMSTNFSSYQLGITPPGAGR